MASRGRKARRDEIARAILEEFGAETADEAQEALRRILGTTIEAVPKDGTDLSDVESRVISMRAWDVAARRRPDRLGDLRLPDGR